ncbi:MAG TPA: alpha/beta hydrolase [Burkholderiales bacterium]|nr:alpha/beta hydrolase [Burkholderiales bacterium]
MARAPAFRHPDCLMSEEIRSTDLVTSDGVRLHVLEAGPAGRARAGGTAPVLAFVPGWSMPAAIWRPQLVQLGASRRVAALDPRGQGDSDVPASGFDIDRRADDVAEFVARYERPVLIGWSLGALEALHFIHRHGADRLAGLVLVDSSVGEEPAPPPAGDFLESLRRDRRATLEQFVRDMFHSLRSDEELAALTDSALRMPLDASLSLFPRSVPREHWRGIARAFRKPLMYVVTEQFAAQAQNLLRQRPGTRVEIFEAAGHALFVDEPDRFNRVLLAFTEEVVLDRAPRPSHGPSHGG